MKTQGEPLAGDEKHCPVCGKVFWATRQWVYKIGYDNKPATYVCSWKCLRKAEAEREDAKQRNKAKRAGRRAEIPGDGDETVFGPWDGTNGQAWDG